MPKSRNNTYELKNTKKYLLEEEEKEEEEEITEIKVENNDVYLYTDINNEIALNFNIEIKKLEKKLLIFSIEYGIDPPEIKLHINSDGGCIFSAISMVDTIKNCKVPVNTIIEGRAASAATLISVCGDKRQITRNSHMLIHQLNTGFFGKHNEFEDEMTNQKTLMKLIKKIYKEQTSITEKKLNECLIKDIWWTSNYCLRTNLVDEIIE